MRNTHRLDELAQLSQAHRALIETAETAYRQVAAGRLSVERFFYDVIIISDITNHQLEEDRAFFHAKPDKPI